MTDLLVIQGPEPPSRQFQLMLLAVGVVTVIVCWLILRPFIPRYRRWLLSPHPLRTNVILCCVSILWGGGLWALIVTQHSYDNIAAIIAASVLVCGGVFFLIKTLVRRA